MPTEYTTDSEDAKNLSAPIGVFDSGLGGLTAVKQLREIMPRENIVYFGDTGRVPYGNRSVETIRKYARQDASFLLSKDVKLVIAACGTVSSTADGLGDTLPVPYLNVIRPTASAAVNATRNGKIGVIGTAATIASGSYKREIQKLDRSIKVYEQHCPLFVPLVEEGFFSKDDPITKLTVERYLCTLREQGVDTVILGCTHYPLLKAAIGEYVGMDVRLIDSGKETALEAARLLKRLELTNRDTAQGKCSFFVSDRTEGFSRLASIFLKAIIGDDVCRVDILKY